MNPLVVDPYVMRELQRLAAEGTDAEKERAKAWLARCIEQKPMPVERREGNARSR